MDIDVASKLFPNLTTMIVQLLSTGVMFFCFKRFLWKYVQAYLGKRADFIEGNMFVFFCNVRGIVHEIYESSEEKTRK